MFSKRVLTRRVTFILNYSLRGRCPRPGLIIGFFII
jgi:hypothetical protein